MKGSVKLPVFIDDARKYVNTTQLRAKYLGASYEAEYCQWQTLHGLGSLMETASLIITPNAFLEGKLIASYPPDPIGDMSVVRATTATRVNSAGLVELVPYNLAQYSQTFNNGVWGALGYGNVATIVPNDTIAPDGTMTASKATFTASGTQGRLAQSISATVGLAYNASVYVKEGNKTNINFYSDTAFGTFITFDFTTGTITNSNNIYGSDIDNVGNGWYRISFWSIAPFTTAQFGFITFGGEDGFCYIWGSQFEQNQVPTTYQKTETRLNIPRLDYSNGTCPSILVEPQRTNYIWYSSSFDVSGAWGAIDTTIIANTTISPSGIQDAETMTITSSTSRIFQTLALGAGTYTASIYVKSLSGTPTIQFRMVVDGTDITESIPTTTEWVRHDFTFTASSSVSYFVIRGESGTGSVAIWGSQLELGSYPTSYIPTTSASVTRNADVVSKTGISSLIGQTEGTMFCDSYINISNNQLSGLLGITNTVENFIYLFYIGNQVYQQTNIGGALNTTYIATIPSSGRYKIALAYKSNDFSFYINGTQVWQTTTASVPACSDVSFQNATLGINSGSNINASALWKTRLTNTQLAQLTTI